MDYASLYSALSSSSSSGSIDLVGYDACVSAQVEVMDTWSAFSGVFVGSQDYVGWGGIDYSLVVAAIQTNPDIAPSDLSVVVADSLLTDTTDKCASAFRLDENFDRIVADINALSLMFLKYLDNPYNIRQQLLNIRDATPQTPNYPADEFHRDLYSMAQGMAALTEYPDIVLAASDLISAFNSSLIYNNVPTTGHGFPSCRGGRGITIYWPQSGEGPSLDYLKTSFAEKTHWDEFLKIF